MITAGKKIFIVPVVFTIIGIAMMIFLDSAYYFMLFMLPTWLTMFLIANRWTRRRKASRVHVSYVCDICGAGFEGERCPRCGSRSKRALF